jgi:hypothetical protein
MTTKNTKGFTMDQEKKVFTNEMDQLISIDYYKLIGSYFNDQVRDKEKFDTLFDIAKRCYKLNLDQMFLNAWSQFWTIENETYQDLQIDKIFYLR